jgi:hypothetical protein
VQQLLSVTVIDNLLPVQSTEASQTLYDLVKNPEGYYDHLRRYSTAVIQASVFGQRGRDFSSDKVRRFYDVQDQFTALLEPGATPPVDAFPILKYIPDILGSWKPIARSIRTKQKALYHSLLQETKLAMAEGTSLDCFMATLVREQGKNQLSDERLAYIGGILV